MNGHLNRIVVSALASSCALLLLQSSVGATTIIPRTIAEAAATAQVIFAGRVTQIRPERAGQYNTIVTRVTFDAVTEVKGVVQRGRSMLLLRGGRIGNEEIGVDGQPQFSVGGEYVVFCTTDDFGSEANRFVPTLGMFEGVFRVGTQGTGAGNVVFDPVGRPVVGIESGRLIVLDATKEGGSGKKMTPPIVSQDRTRRVDPNEREIASSPRPAAPPADSKRVGATPSSGPKPPKPSRRTRETADPSTGHKTVPSIPKEPTVLVLDPTNDPGTRMSLERFLEALRAMTR